MLATQSTAAQSTRYRSNRWRTQLVIILFSASIVTGLIAVSFDVSRVVLVARVSHGEQITRNEAETSDAFQRNIALIQAGLYVVAGVVFLAWLYRAYKNVNAFGAESLTSSPGSALISFFVPMLNLYLPAVAVSELWKASDPAITAGEAWQQARHSRLVIIWWLVILAWGIARVIQSIFRLRLDPLGRVTFDYYMRLAQTDVVLDAFFAVSALLSLMLVYRINRRQEIKAQIGP